MEFVRLGGTVKHKCFQLDTPEPGTGGGPSDYFPLRNAADREIIFTPRESEHSRVPAHPPASAPTLVSAVEQQPVSSSTALRRPLGGPALAVAFLIYPPSVSRIVPCLLLFSYQGARIT